jgi:hypothetical protein
VQEAEQREENEEASRLHLQHCFIFWSFLQHIPNCSFSAHPDGSVSTFAVTWCICPLIDTVRCQIAPLQRRCTAQTLSLQRVDRHDMCDSNVTRSRGNFLELLNKSQTGESTCAFLLVECSPHATGSSHMADQQNRALLLVCVVADIHTQCQHNLVLAHRDTGTGFCTVRSDRHFCLFTVSLFTGYPSFRFLTGMTAFITHDFLVSLNSFSLITAI